MEFSIKTMIIFFLGVAALLILVMLFMQTQGSGSSMLDDIFGWFKIFGSGA